MLPLESTAICGKSADPPGLFERLTGAENVAPPSEDRLKKTEELPGLLSRQTTLIFPRPSTAIWGTCELPASFETFRGGEKGTCCACAASAAIPRANTHKLTRCKRCHPRPPNRLMRSALVPNFHRTATWKAGFQSALLWFRPPCGLCSLLWSL